MLRLRTFGGLSLSSDGARGAAGSNPANAQRRSLSLLAILAANGGTISRDRVIGILWPESDPQSARTALRQAVYSVRRELDADVIVANGSNLDVRGEMITSDVQEFQTALENGEEDRAV